MKPNCLRLACLIQANFDNLFSCECLAPSRVTYSRMDILARIIMNAFFDTEVSSSCGHGTKAVIQNHKSINE